MPPVWRASSSECASFVGARIEIVIVLRFVDAHAPQNNRGMIPVAPDHFAHVADRYILPGLVADVLPAGNLLQHQQAEFIAGIQKMPATADSARFAPGSASIPA